MTSGLNIGQVNFGVDARTEGLQKAMARLAKFQAMVDKVARTQKKGAATALNAYARQEQAIRKAFQATLNLQQQQRKADAAKEQIDATTHAFQRLTREMSSGQLNTVQFNRSLDAFNTRIGRLRRGLTEVGHSSDQGLTRMQKLRLATRDLESASVLALGPLSGLGARVRSLGAIASRGNIAIAAFAGGIVAAVVGAGKLTAAILRTDIAMQRVQSRFEFATNSTALAAREMKFVFSVAQSLGLKLNDLAKSYSRLTAATAGTSLAGEETRRIFLAVSKAAAVLKLDASETEGVFRALEQMISKGTVQAEELRGQFGERMPGAFRLAAEAMGMTTRDLGKLLKTGELLSDDLIPKLRKRLDEVTGDKAAKNANTLQGSWNRLTNTGTLFLANLDRVSHVSAIVTHELNRATQWMEFFGGTIKNATGGVQDFGDALDKLKTDKPIELTRVFEGLSGELDTLATGLHTSQEVLGFLDRIKDPELLLKHFQNLTKFEKANNDELTEMAARLAKVLGSPVAANLDDVAGAWLRLSERAHEANEAVQGAIAKQVAGRKALEDIPKTFKEMEDRIAALRSGPNGIKVYDDFTTKVQAFDEMLQRTNFTAEQQNQYSKEHRMLLAQILALTAALNAQEQKRKEATQQQERTAEALRRAAEATDLIREKTAALAAGPRGLRIYQEIQEPLARFVEQLHRQGVAEEDITRAVQMHEQALWALFDAQDQVNASATQAADAVVNSIEGLIMKTKEATDVLKELGRELFRIFVRATFLDPLLEGLSQVFSGGLRNAGIGTQTAFAGKAGKAGLPGGYTGMQFKVGGSGGSDDKLVKFYARAGEDVIVRRPSQANGRMGGDIYLTISAPGADAGTIARIEEIVRIKLAPQIIRQASDTTIARIKRPKFA